MGEKRTRPFQLTFNGFLKVDFHGSRVTSDGGLTLIRELDERLGLGWRLRLHDHLDAFLLATVKPHRVPGRKKRRQRAPRRKRRGSEAVYCRGRVQNHLGGAKASIIV